MSYTVKPLKPKHSKRLINGYGYDATVMEFNPGKCPLPQLHCKFVQQILDAPVREDDIWLVSYPRTGSTWCQEMIWLLVNNLDFDTASNTIQQIRAPLLEMSTVLFEYHESIGKEAMDNSVEFIKNLPSPRCIKSHLPWPLLPTQLDTVKPKIIYTFRNPKDMCVSFYYYSKMLHHFQRSFDEFCDILITGLIPPGPVFSHYLDFWKKRNEDNILLLKYEDMNKDLRGTVKKLASFLDKSYSEEDYDKLCDFLSFQKMRNNKGCNAEPIVDKVHGKDYYKRVGSHFMRKGQMGDWKNHMSEELAKKFDDWIEENTRGTGLIFD